VGHRWAAAALLAAGSTVSAQQLEPRAYSPNPTGANFVIAAYGRSQGNVVLDPSLPIRNVRSAINLPTIGYGRTFGLFGRSASAAVVVPYVWGHVSGEVAEQARRVTRSGLSDSGVRLAVNLVGGPALPPREFARRPLTTSLGVSLAVLAPTGQYASSKLINLGSNRWGFKPELGLSRPLGRWSFEAYGGFWLYTDNDAFLGNVRREQDPILSLQAHVVYSFKTRLWLAGDATFYAGGRTTQAGEPKADELRNSRLGLTLALPVSRHHSAKASWTTGFTTRAGGNFRTLSVAWQYLWLDARP
jgi:hypothetical protein